MKIKKIASIFLVSLTLFIVNVVFAGAIEKLIPSENNFSYIKQQLQKYHDSGKYEKDIQAVANSIAAHLETVNQIKQQYKHKKLAIVFDIDETTLSNYPAMAANQYAYFPKGKCYLPKGPCGWDNWVNLKQAKAIKPLLTIFNLAKNKGIEIFFISGRHEHQRQVTLENLKAAGYDKHNLNQHLILKPNHFKGTAEAYKTPERKKIEKAGYVIIANIGDQKSDLVGGLALKTFKLPNRFYFIP